MIPSIITADLRIGNFIKDGLRYENMGSEVIECRDGLLNVNLVGFTEAVIILTDDINYLTRVYKILKEHKPKMIICHLTETLYDPGLDFNTDKYFLTYVSPYYFKSIVTTIKALVYNTRSEGLVKKFVFKDIEMDVMRREVKICNSEVYFRNKEFELLHFLLSNKGRLLTRDMILDSVWDRNSDNLTNTVDVHISYLRKKIAKKTEVEYIKTIPCSGYILE